MGTENSASSGNPWVLWALLTVLSWGVYGVILHKGRGYMPMGSETPHAGLKAFLFVCIAYVLVFYHWFRFYCNWFLSVNRIRSNIFSNDFVCCNIFWLGWFA